MKITSSLFIILFSTLIALGQDFPIPENYEMIDTIYGDLDQDGIQELVVAYNTMKEDTQYLDEGIPRELIIYKIQNSKWNIWQRSLQALYGSQDGGMMGDPFGEIEIKNGVLLISQNGGSSWKWGHTDKYRFQDGEFYLIGYTGTYGKLCEYWEEIDFNLMTGELVVKKEFEDCENSTQEIYKRENATMIEKGLMITLKNRHEKEIKLVTPKYKHEIYIE